MRYISNTDSIECTVDEICRIAFMGGSIDCRVAPKSNLGKKKPDSKIYQKLHTMLGMQYYDNVKISNTIKLDDIYFSVSGTMDGILCSNGSYTVDELVVVDSSKYSKALFIEKSIEDYHNARLVCHGYFVCRAKEINEIKMRLVIYDKSNDSFDFIEKKADLLSLREKYIEILFHSLWLGKDLFNLEKTVRPNASKVKFPYPSLRESQAEMIKECYRDIKHGNRLFCQAPTGIGKTISTLYPSVKCVGEGIADKIFYLTSKQSIRREAISAMNKLNGAGANFRTCVISSKESMCNNIIAKNASKKISSYCNPDTCPYAAGYYDRLPKALQKIISLGSIYDSKMISAVAAEYKICPYEFSLDLSELCQVIICDYNYVFSPTVYLRRYFDDRDENGAQYIFLIDEAHNLPDRAREMFSSEISTNCLVRAMSLLEENSMLQDPLNNTVMLMKKIGRLCDDNIKHFDDGRYIGYCVEKNNSIQFLENLELLSRKLDIWLKNNIDHIAYNTIDDIRYNIYEYCKISDYYDKQYITFITKSDEGVNMLQYCLDPSEQLSVMLDRAKASVLFSATLTPTEYFADILGGGKKSVSVDFPSPFPSNNLCVAVMDNINTRYEEREKSYKKISSAIAATASAKCGNYIVFFPSYSYMDEVYKIFSEKYSHIQLLKQGKGMTAGEKERFISEFCDDGKTRIGFCVLGGSFSEGIDLPGKKLIGVIVVGVGLPGLSNENNIIRDYYEEKCGMGYDYAYTYPGMNSVLQAVGRLIRREDDRGIAVLIDDRYSENKYMQLFPVSWSNIKHVSNARDLLGIAQAFWQMKCH